MDTNRSVDAVVSAAVVVAFLLPWNACWVESDGCWTFASAVWQVSNDGTLRGLGTALFLSLPALCHAGNLYAVLVSSARRSSPLLLVVPALVWALYLVAGSLQVGSVPVSKFELPGGAGGTITVLGTALGPILALLSPHSLPLRGRLRSLEGTTSTGRK